MTEFVYPMDLVMNYKDNGEYRAVLRTLFQMNTANYNELAMDETLDDITRDEMAYDEPATIKGMDWIYSKIQDQPLFQALLDKAAAKFLSEDRTIGLTVLICYDYLALFHECIKDFLNAPSEFTETSPSYLVLLTKM